MPLVSSSASLIANLIIGTDNTVKFGTNAQIGVGNSSLPFNANQTTLYGSNPAPVYRTVDSRPTIANGTTITWTATFPTTSANFTWQERGIFAPTSGESKAMLSRYVVNMGTKTNAVSWQIKCTDTIVISS